MAGLTFLRVVDNATLDQREREQIAREQDARQNDPVVLGIVAHLRACWDAAKRAKQPIERIMLRALRQRNGEYEADKLAHIKAQGGSEVYMMITEVKCRAAESWLRDILLDQGMPPWSLEPTALPELPPDTERAVEQAFAQRVLQRLQARGQAPTVEEMNEEREATLQDFRLRQLHEAHNRAGRMKDRIEDQFEQGGWGDAFNAFLTDVVTFPAAFVKGPVVRRQRTLGYKTAPDGSVIVEATDRLGPEFERVDPFRIYPEPGVTHINDGYLFEHHRMSRTDLADLVGVPGYDDEAVRSVLMEGSGASWVSSFNEGEKEREERKFDVGASPTETFDALEFWGKVSGKMLLEWGLDTQEVEDPAREYDVNAWVVGNTCIKVVLNYDPLGEKPYARTSFIRQPGAFWGKGIPEIIEDLQNVCNAAARALINNMALASGPQVEVNLERIPPNEDITQLHPWKIWQTMNDPLGSSAPAVRFAQPDSRANELMGVYDRFSRLADDHSGIPAYVYGDLNVKGAGRTASGLSMLMGSAGKGIRQVVMHIDKDIIYPVVRRQFVYNMRYDTDNTIKGDVDIVPRGAINLAAKETVNMRRLEFLNATANPADLEIIGADGRAALLREVAKGLQMPVDDIVPSREKRAVDQTQAASLAAQATTPGQTQGAVGGAGAGGGAPPPTPTFPGGMPMGGTQANTVGNRPSGGA